MNYDTGRGDFVNVDGNLVEKDALNIAERLQDYDDNLKILCLDPARADLNDAPFVIVCMREDGTYYKVFEAWKLDDTILERVYNADKARFDPYAKMEVLAESIRAAKKRRYEEKRLEALDIVATTMKNRTSSFSYKDSETGDKVTIYDDKPSVRGDGRSYSYT